jgi:hypothetical protein
MVNQSQNHLTHLRLWFSQILDTKLRRAGPLCLETDNYSTTLRPFVSPSPPPVHQLLLKHSEYPNLILPVGHEAAKMSDKLTRCVQPNA